MSLFDSLSNGVLFETPYSLFGASHLVDNTSVYVHVRFDLERYSTIILQSAYIAMLT